ncbi:type II toxin-antitoxin system HicB family antitoxin [Methylobacillus flagellatus]|uniref:type II toxin-antitoxin system HicB family antitoxin n=1 Tax=Methylobacillus flagellatus TaxID=405 RepID=UPI002854172B|nr:type II toxin-antitoxin system HicB family antitoxin [Methylobacillus flagellatus]MDR5170707.1 type II toxin-antitoxin system HicB family antitoxin [Methylobacillus flagellatus]
MSELTYKGYTGSVETSIEDECLHGKILFINDVITYEGDTVPELKSNFESAVERYIHYCNDKGVEPNKPYSGTFNVRIGPERHALIAKEAMKAGNSLNAEFVKIVDLHFKQKEQAASSAHISQAWQDAIRKEMASGVLTPNTLEAFTLGLRIPLEGVATKPVVHQEKIWLNNPASLIN